MFEKFWEEVKSLAFRIQVLKGFCLFLVCVLAMRLYAVQITYHDSYETYRERSSVQYLQTKVPRGRIYDRNFNILVDNQSLPAITFQSQLGMGTAQTREVALELANLIELMPPGEHQDYGLKERDLKDLYLYLNPDVLNELVSPEEAEGLKKEEVYKIQVSRVTPEMTATLTDLEKEAHAIYNRMIQGGSQTANLIKSGATLEETAVVSEHLASLPGVDVGTDWERVYPEEALGENGFNALFGRVSTATQGLPANMVTEYMAYGYQGNDRVGLSQLELAYEPFLRGYNAQNLLVKDKNSQTYLELYEGQSGFQMALTLDIQLQERVNEIIESKLLWNKRANNGIAAYLQEAYVVILDPNTGEILSMNGKIIQRNEAGEWEVIDAPLGTFQSAFTMGSVVKGASLMTGYANGATRLDTYRFDEPLYFQGSAPKKSWKNMGYVGASDALKFSSNIFFMKQTMEMGGASYIPHGKLRLDTGIYATYRDYFSRFGLGSSTGIDLPNESIGLRDSSGTAAKLLDFAIGQADTYTTMQLAQYAATLATFGSRYATHLVKDIYLPSNESEGMQLFESIEPKLLDQIDLGDEYFEMVRLGFRRALNENGGTGYGVFAGSGHLKAAGKTGTAEEYARDQEGRVIKNDQGEPLYKVHNTTFIGYAPWDDPEIAIAVILPQAELADGKANYSAQEIARDAMEAYFSLQKSRK